MPSAIYVWLVPSAEVLEQPGGWRIRKWDTEPFPEANFTLASSETKPTIPAEFMQLAMFYSAIDMHGLIKEMDGHIRKLQTMLPPLRDTEPRNVREG